jgi:hypothetical protein
MIARLPCYGRLIQRSCDHHKGARCAGTGIPRSSARVSEQHPLAARGRDERTNEDWPDAEARLPSPGWLG